MRTSCIVIVGKPGAGKSSIGSELAKRLGGTYLSLGGFMREVLGIPDPHIGIDKNIVYRRLSEHLADGWASGTLVLDCHPYPEGDLEALLSFLKRPSLTLCAVVHIIADDAVALRRLRRRPRPGQTDEERIKYFNDNVAFIDLLLAHPLSVRSLLIENSMNSDDLSEIERIAEEIVRAL